ASGELPFASGPLPGLGIGRTWGGLGGGVGQGECDAEAGRAGPDEVEPAAVGLHQRAGQRQADAVPALAGHPALEEPGAGPRVDARSLVLDGEMAVVA